MSRDIISTRNTSFIPRQHGYQFRNSNIRWQFSGFSGRFLCGGLSYTSIEYFHSRLPVPRDTRPPAPGTILNEYILSRQINAHGFAIPRLIHERFRNHEALFLTGVRMSESFGGVVAQIDQQKPVPILLVDVGEPLSTDSHWVVAIGYEMDEAPPDYGGRKCGRVMIYDSNYPGIKCHLTPDAQNNRFVHSQGVFYRTYIPDTGFRPVNLRQPRYRPLHGLAPRSTTRQNSTPFF